MIRLLVLMLILTAATAHAGFKMYVPGQKEPAMIFEDPDPTPQPPSQPPQTYQQNTESAYTPAKNRRPEVDDVDMSGVEWRRTRGLYSGRGAEDMTKKFGYRAGTYRLEYVYKARGHFAIWMYTRRGMSELLVNRVGKADTQTTVVLPKDDEVWFEIHSSTGNWEFTFERIR